MQKHRHSHTGNHKLTLPPGPLQSHAKTDMRTPMHRHTHTLSCRRTLPPRTHSLTPVPGFFLAGRVQKVTSMLRAARRAILVPWRAPLAPPFLPHTYTYTVVRHSSAIAGNGATTFALATSSGKAAIAVFRVSGPQAQSVLRALITAPGDTAEPVLPRPRHLAFRRLYCPSSGACLDHGMVAWFPGPRSFTGEDVVELHLHGGRAVVQAMQRSLATIQVWLCMLGVCCVWLCYGVCGCGVSCVAV